MAKPNSRFRFRGSVEPSAEVKRPVRTYRNADSTDATGTKSSSGTIDIFDVIDSYGGWWGISAGEVDQALAKLGKVDTLFVRVNSPGGEATEGFAIANLLRAHAAKVHITNYGLAASAASFISIAGDTFSMAPGSMLMIHEAAIAVWGQADALRSEADILDKFNESIAGLYALKGGTDTDWRALMHVETWFTPEDAVEVGLADKVGIDVAPPPVNPDDQAEPLPGGSDAPFDRAAQLFDLSVFEHAPAAFAAHKPPAEPPVHVPTQPEEAVNMTPEDIKALRERLGLAEDADFTAIDAKLTELEDAATKPDEPPAATDPTDEQIAAHLAKTGKTLITDVALEELKANSALGVEARKQQLDETRDKTIAQAVTDGKISRDRVEAWTNAWDKDPDGVKADLDALEARFPVGAASGYSGSDGSDGAGVIFNDDEAGALAALAGVSKEALTNG